MAEGMYALTDTVFVQTSAAHGFGTDAFLLARFADIRRSDRLLADLGTGCGIIPLIWAAAKTPRRIFGLELQEKGIAQFRASLAASETVSEVTPVWGDLRDLPGELPRAQFDLVSCNPPYQTAGSGFLSAAPSDQLARHELTCTVADVCAAAEKLLRFGGRLCICQRPERLPDVMEAMRTHGIEPKRLRFVSKRADTAPWLFLLEGKKGAHASLRVEPPLCVYENENYTPAMEAVYRGLEDPFGKEEE